MAVYIINNGSGLLDQLKVLLSSYSPIVIDRCDLSDFKPDKNDLLILSGGHELPVLWHNKEYADELRLVKKHKGPIIGICLGFELITHAYGAHLHKLTDRLHRTIRIYNTKFSDIIPEQTDINVFESHTWATLHVKSPLVPLAFSDEGIEIIRHKRKPIFGLQFHPEHTSDSNGYIIFSNIIREIYKQTETINESK